MALTNKRAVHGWMMYDWAAQPFSTLLVTFFYGPYFVSQIAQDSVSGQTTWAWMTAIAAILIALLAPVLGTKVDTIGPRKPWILGFSLIYVIATALLWLGVPKMEDPLIILLAFGAAMIAVELTFVFSNAYLPEVAAPEDVGKYSSYGWALGYAGGFVSVLIVLGFFAEFSNGKTFLGLDPGLGLLKAEQFEGTRSIGPLSAIWYMLFIVPFFLWVPEAPRRAVKAGSNVLKELTTSLRDLPNQPSLLYFLGASMLYRDALLGLYAFGGIYAAGVLDWGIAQLGIFAVLGLVFGCLGALIGGRLDAKIGPKPIVVVSIIALTLTSILAISTTRDQVLGMAIAEGSGLPDQLFYFYGCLIGAFGGTVQASSRTMMVHQVHDKTRMTEYFGLYAVAGKATSFIAPASVAVVTELTQSQAFGISPVIVLFIIGLILLYKVRP